VKGVVVVSSVHTTPPVLVGHGPVRHGHALAALLAVVAAVVVALGAWALVDRLTSTSGTATAPSASVAAFSEPAMALQVSGLRALLRDAGYAIPATGVLDPVTRSAAADYLQPGGAAGPLSALLQGTILTGHRDPAAWNVRFGVARATRMVERALTGPGGQLDRNGNVR